MTRRKPALKLPRKASYEVGYGKPPVETRFAPGTSGNPKGRPKGAKNRPASIDDLSQIILAESRRMVPVNEGGKIKMMRSFEVQLRTLTAAGMKGSVAALHTSLDLAVAAEQIGSRRWQSTADSAIAYKVEGERRLAEAERNGIELPPMVPDPRNMLIEDDRITVIGPNTPDEKRLFDAIAAELRASRLRLVKAKRALPQSTGPAHVRARDSVAMLERVIALFEERLARFRTIIEPW